MNNLYNNSLRSLVTDRFPPFQYIKFHSSFKNIKKNQIITLYGKIPAGATKILCSYISGNNILPEDTFINIGFSSEEKTPNKILKNFSIDVLNKCGIEGKGTFLSPIKNLKSEDKIVISFNNDVIEGKIQVQLLFLTPVHN